MFNGTTFDGDFVLVYPPVSSARKFHIFICYFRKYLKRNSPAGVSANIAVSSCWTLIYLHFMQNISLDQSIQKKFYFILKTGALKLIACRLVTRTSTLVQSVKHSEHGAQPVTRASSRMTRSSTPTTTHSGTCAIRSSSFLFSTWRSTDSCGTQSFCFHIWIWYLQDTLILLLLSLIIKIHNFWGDLTNLSATTQSLAVGPQ